MAIGMIAYGMSFGNYFLNDIRMLYYLPTDAKKSCLGIIFLEDKLLINDGGTKSNIDMGNSALFQKLNQLIVNSVKGNLFQDSDFDMEYFKARDYYKVVFTPKDEKIKNYIATFILIFDKDQATVHEVRMVEPSDDFTRIVFTNRKINQTVNDAVFSN